MLSNDVDKLQKKTRFYQASTSELYGKVKEIPQNEKTPFNPFPQYSIFDPFTETEKDILLFSSSVSYTHLTLPTKA